MFSTFSTTSGRLEDRKRTKRKQVARACDYCRMNRVKCDDQAPCKNCQHRGSICSNSHLEKPQTMPTASREVSRLKARVESLESELDDRRQTPQFEPVVPSKRSEGISGNSSGSSNSVYETSNTETRPWGGAWIAGSQGNGAQYHSRNSPMFYMSRVRDYLSQTLDQPELSDLFGLKRLDALHLNCISGIGISMSENTADGRTMTRRQEEHHLDLFWQSHHLTMPVLDEQDFQEYYQGLWSINAAQRKPSALVDVMLALCVQYSAAFASQNAGMLGATAEDAGAAGYWLFQRSQRLLIQDRESVGLYTVRCYILAVIFLSNASMVNTAHQLLAIAVCNSHLVGLDRTDNPELSPLQLRNRQLVWRCLYYLDSKMSFESGRPFLINTPNARVGDLHTMPTDPTQSAQITYTSFNGVDILDFHKYSVELINIIRTAHKSFGDKTASLLYENNNVDLYKHPEALEKSARHLLQCMGPIREWAQSVPTPLRIPRKGFGQAFSTSRSPLDTDAYVPLWLQRQRLLLELLYHNLVLSLYRPFIRFPPMSKPMTPLSSEHNVTCLNHAVVTANIIAHFVAETGVINSVHTIYRFQWDAMLVLIGFGLAHPLCPHSSSARNAIQMSITTFRTLAQYNLGAASVAADVTKDLYDCIEVLAIHLREDHSTLSALPSPPASLSLQRSSPVQLTQTQASLLPTPVDSRFSSPMQSVPRPNSTAFIPTTQSVGALGSIPAIDGSITSGYDTVGTAGDISQPGNNATWSFPLEGSFSFNPGLADFSGFDEWTDMVMDQQTEVGHEHQRATNHHEV